MRRISVLLMVFVLIAALSGGAMAARWEKQEIPVWDMTSEAWRPAVQAAITDYNTNLPPEVPRLRYIPMGEMSCDALPQYGKKGGVTLCMAGPGDLGRSRQELWFPRRAKVILQPGDVPRASYVLCHELGHAVIGIPDDYRNPHWGESCVQGGLSYLGSWDIAYAKQVYANDGGRSFGDRPQHRKHHRRH